MGRLIRNHRFKILIFVALFFGFFIRIQLVDKVVVGDLMNYAEWGQKLIENGPRGYYFSKGWYYSVPVYPPIAIWTFAGSFWLFEHKFVFAQVHNVLRFPPAGFIVYFYKWGYIFLLKLLAIISDLCLSVVVYKLIFSLAKNRKKSYLGMIFFLFNPVSIFISSAWGQTDSVVAILGIISFLLLLKKTSALSIPIMFLGLYFKPSWAIFGPFYLYLLYLTKPKWSQVLIGSLFSFTIFFVVTKPFVEGNLLSYSWKLFRERYPIPLGIDGKASISAFNFQTIFFRLDIDYSHQKLLGITSSFWGTIAYFMVNVFAFINLRRQKNILLGTISGLFIVGMGSFLFMPTMLERYFFPAFIPLIVLIFSRPRLIFWGVIMNTILMANIIYSFYRRGSDEIARPFTDNNFLFIRILSVLQVISFAAIATNLLKSVSGTPERNTS